MTAKYCPHCNGTGRDEKTAATYRRESSSSGYVTCWNCNGNGLDPAAYFRWSKPAEPDDGDFMEGYSESDLKSPDGFSNP